MDRDHKNVNAFILLASRRRDTTLDYYSQCRKSGFSWNKSFALICTKASSPFVLSKLAIKLDVTHAPPYTTHCQLALANELGTSLAVIDHDRTFATSVSTVVSDLRDERRLERINRSQWMRHEWPRPRFNHTLERFSLATRRGDGLTAGGYRWIHPSVG